MPFSHGLFCQYTTIVSRLVEQANTETPGQKALVAKTFKHLEFSVGYNQRVPTEPQSIVFPIFNSVYFQSAIKLARYLQSSGKFRPVFFFLLDTYRPSPEQLNLLREHEIRYEQAEAIGDGMPAKVLRVLSSRILVFEVLTILYRGAVLGRELTKLIKSQNVRLFLLPADNRYFYPQVTAMAKSARIRVAIFPSWFANESELIRAFSESPIYTQGLRHGVLSKLWKPYVLQLETPGKKCKFMIPFPKGEIISRKILGVEVPNPWILHSTHADLIFVETATALDYAKRLGFDERKLKLIGSVFLDEMHSTQQRISINSSSPSRKNFVTSALPPDMFSYSVAEHCKFKSYAALVDAWCSALKEIPNSRIVISLHPTTSLNIANQVRRHGIHVSSEETHLLIAQSDLYIASISATIQWAISAGVPVVNYDVYGYCYPDYDGISSVTLVKSYSEFKKILETAIHGLIPNSNRDPKIIGGNPSSQLDGKSGDRTLAEITKLLSSTHGLD